ncbi:alan shepard, partial [Carabus blaptoides fortunei]
NADGSCRGYGFVNFLEPCAAKRAVEELNGKEVTPGKKLHVSKAQTRDERRKMPSFFDEAKLDHQFREFGSVASVQIAKDKGQNLGFAIVRLCSLDSAYTAAM